MNYEKIANEVIAEMSGKLDEFSPKETDMVGNLESYKIGMVAIAAEVCKKMLEKHDATK